jgi:hypothetical protein
MGPVSPGPVASQDRSGSGDPLRSSPDCRDLQETTMPTLAGLIIPIIDVLFSPPLFFDDRLLAFVQHLIDRARARKGAPASAR